MLLKNYQAAVLNQNLEKIHSHSGKFTKSWKNPTPKVENWKPNKHSVDHLSLILFLYSVIKKMFFQTTPLSTHLKKEEKKEKIPSDLKFDEKKY